MRRAFTLIEMLVVVAIIGILVAILFPVLASTREQGRRAACTAQLRQIGMGLALYRQDNTGLPFLLSSVWPQYVNDARLFVCPDDVQKGQFTGNDRLEGNLHLVSGVSYEYMPDWQVAHDLGWYLPAPNFGPGKWDDLTPLAGCPWHWAKRFDPNKSANDPGSEGWELILTLGGAVRKIRVESPLAQFTPEQYH